VATNLRDQGLAVATNLRDQGLAVATNLRAQGSAALDRLVSLRNSFSGAGDLVSGTKVAAAFNNTVNRKTVDAATSRILGNSKITAPTFEFPSPASLLQKLDLAQAQNILQGVKQQGDQVLGQATQLRSQVTQLAGQTTSTFNRLTG
jgi:pyridoxal/pyridoxine/pyridoxamine kinase